MPLSGNRGEWSEIYIFLKLIEDGKLYAADKDMNKLLKVYLNVIKIIREEYSGKVFDYVLDEGGVNVLLNDVVVGPELSKNEYGKWRAKVWELIKDSPRGNKLTSPQIEAFLATVHITKLKAPASSSSDFFGGTQDITMQVQDFRSGITSVVGFSCKSDLTTKATLFNASYENTNFIFKVSGNINDAVMEQFNDIWGYRRNGGEIERVFAVKERMQFLKRAGCNLQYHDMAVTAAKRNLILSGDLELPKIVGEMMRYYYLIGENQRKYCPLTQAIDYVVEHDVASYGFTGLESLYRRKIGNLMYDMFTGMRLSKPWDGRSSVNGGYIVAKDDGDVVAYHSCIADEFKDFLVEQLGFETPSANRHKFMEIYKDTGEYYIKLNLQIRFKGDASD